VTISLGGQGSAVEPGVPVRLRMEITRLNLEMVKSVISLQLGDWGPA
jgi:hypothetical protein